MRAALLHETLMNTPEEDLTPEQRKTKDNMRTWNTPDEQLGPMQKKLKENMRIMITPDEQLTQDQQKIKQRLKLMHTPDDQLTPDQRKAKKHMVRSKGDVRHVNNTALRRMESDITAVVISLLQERKH